MSSQLQRREESRMVSLSYAGATEANRSFFLRTKLLLPNSTVTFLPRPRLIGRLAANVAHLVTLVTGNAGSGKTTLVADFVRSQTHPYLWYQLDHTDADPAVFLGYIVHRIRQIIRDFGQATLDYLQQETAEVNQHLERAVDMLISDLLDRIDEEMILVLDDYDSLGRATKVHVAVERLLAYLPDVMRVIITSYEMAPLHLAPQRSQSTLAIIDSDDLLFTDEEMQAFFRQVFDPELTPQQLAECRERTQG
jgi:LuxR family transcriptional regulator, maltose regulon positive regulatory protein